MAGNVFGLGSSTFSGVYISYIYIYIWIKKFNCI
jgi:hypothetical protein